MFRMAIKKRCTLTEIIDTLLTYTWKFTKNCEYETIFTNIMQGM